MVPYQVVCSQTDRPSWLKARKTGVGGSDAGAILGISKWQTPLAVWVDKTTPLTQVDEPTEDQRWGLLKEPVILQEYARAVGAKLEMMPMIRSAEHPFMLASLDALAHLPDGLRVVDAKSTRSDDGWGEPGTDAIPADYAAQAHHYMAVTGIMRVDFAVLIGSADFRIYTVEADPEIQAGLVAREAEFWQRVVDRNPPQPRTMDDVKALFPMHQPGKRVEAALIVQETVCALVKAKALMTEMEGNVEEMEVIIKTAMSDAEELSYKGQILATWKTSKPRKSLDLDAIERDHPGLIAKYRVDGNSPRPFLLKGPPK